MWEEGVGGVQGGGGRAKGGAESPTALAMTDALFASFPARIVM